MPVDTTHPLVQRLVHAMRKRELYWEEMNDTDRYMINSAVDGCMKECVQMGLGHEARLAIHKLDSDIRLLRDVAAAWEVNDG